jgi:hypothetical protein
MSVPLFAWLVKLYGQKPIVSVTVPGHGLRLTNEIGLVRIRPVWLEGINRAPDIRARRANEPQDLAAEMLPFVTSMAAHWGHTVGIIRTLTGAMTAAL